MKNKKLVVGIAAGVAALAVVGLIVASKNGKLDCNKLAKKAGDFSDKFKSKLGDLQKKAKREFKHVLSEGETAIEKVKNN
ncbi:hypothetical protein [Flavobacterium sp. '19STA2R22 D10 B1']|uniref:hypothetical protein n=1 Tax=Flavobacterium aerium TaxID=3037261 RepID=UPI00278C56C8|nr:hypothetical protein [Flavobacterium sp. '19STA2R22 D10 B1']